ncbi:hypothetical protein BVRB_4g088290 [Beta vulgaris subsp. vulgaris]|nr:hypothetical protein BVRB_4g088290 [Beta vulgaris subsp. vulgaris]
MGNCLRHDSRVHWGGEDWSPEIMKDMSMEEEQLGSCKKDNTSTIKEVKVKLTKKQLEKLLGKIDLQQHGFSTAQILAQLMKVSVQYETHQRSWKPRLQSIPEV